MIADMLVSVKAADWQAIVTGDRRSALNWEGRAACAMCAIVAQRVCTVCAVSDVMTKNVSDHVISKGLAAWFDLRELSPAQTQHDVAQSGSLWDAMFLYPSQLGGSSVESHKYGYG